MEAKTLTKTEDRVIRLKLQGLSRKEIASQTFRSTGTIQRHFQNVYEKLKVQNEIELYNWYLENILEINIKRLLQVIVCLILVLLAEVSQNTEMRRVKTKSSVKTETVLLRAKARSRTKELKYA